MNIIEAGLEAAARRICDAHGPGLNTDGITPGRYPDKEVIAAAVRDLLKIIYPGDAPAEDLLKALLKKVMHDLSRQIQPALPGEAKQTAEQAEEICLRLFEQIPRICALVRSDAQAAYDADPAASGMDEVILCYPGLFAVAVYRLAHVLYELNVPLIPRIMTEYAHSITGIDIHPGAVIGEHFFIDHGTGVVIGETTVIGAFVKLYQGVTLGGLTTRGGQSLRGKKRHPTIEDRVTVYAGASVLGGDTVIGHDCVIGSNAFVTESVPPCTTVSMEMQQLRYKDRSCAGCPKAKGQFA